MAKKLYIKQGDLAEPFEFQLTKDRPPVPLDISNAISVQARFVTIRFHVVFDALTCIVDDPVLGKGHFLWPTGSTDKRGDYYLQITANYALAKPQTFPASGYIETTILQR